MFQLLLLVLKQNKGIVDMNNRRKRNKNRIIAVDLTLSTTEIYLSHAYIDLMPL